MKKRMWLAKFMILCMVLGSLWISPKQSVKAADYTNNGCVRWVRDLASKRLGITLPGTGYNEFGLAGANNFWNVLDYAKGQEPQADSLAIWKYNNGSDGAGGKYGHVAYIESVEGDSITLSEGGYRGATCDGNTGVKRHTVNRSQMPTLGSCSEFLGYIYLGGHNPRGWIDDCVSKEPGKLWIRGWAFDEDALGSSVEIHAHIGDDGNSVGYNTGLADVERVDVDQAFQCGTRHGYDKVIETDRTGNQRVRVFAINLAGGTHTLLFDGVVQIKSVNDPQGWIDTCTSDSTGKIKIAGWAFDRDDYAKNLEIHVYVGPEEDATCYSLGNASGLRPDVDQMFHCGAFHGFDKTIETHRTGNQRVRIFALNIGSGTPTLLFDSTIYVQEKKVVAPDKIRTFSVRKVAKKTMKITWKNPKDVNGSEIQYATNKIFTKGKKTRRYAANIGGLTIKNMASGKTYYVRARAYRLNEVGKRVYGAWSTVKKCKI